MKEKKENNEKINLEKIKEIENKYKREINELKKKISQIIYLILIYRSLIIILI